VILDALLKSDSNNSNAMERLLQKNQEGAIRSQALYLRRLSSAAEKAFAAGGIPHENDFFPAPALK
jgi:hypothetical protein